MSDGALTLTGEIRKGFRSLPNGNTLGFWSQQNGVVMQEWQGRDGTGDLLTQETYDFDRYAQYRADHPDLKLPDFSPPKSGNTIGKVVGEPSVTLPTITVTANPPPKPETPAEGGFWGAVGGWVHGGLDAAGLIPGLGAVPDLLNAGIYAVEGDYVNAGISAVAAIPVVGDAALAGKYAAKGGKLALKESEKLAAKEAEKLAAKEAEEKAAKEAAEKTSKKTEKEAAKEGEDGAKSEGKDNLKCGDSGTYGDLLKQSGGNKFDRDHVPSKAALKQTAADLIDEMGIVLTDAQRKTLFGTKTSPGLIAKEGEASAIDKLDHSGVSRTYGNRNSETQIADDAKDLQKAAGKDTKEIMDNATQWGEKCREKYEKWAEKILKKTHEEYRNDLLKLIKQVISKGK
ncbi:hypothetical protein [Burkholderia cenocepacia]|uniref:Uncharacterized protein n=1 Tax=Burkholderia cenocepacia TaxID=95486 RepID=A0A6B2MGN6_9BURK|nr:hypothetical protein [Burkholderia cenocepacia]NDV73507.1 hypothetical protein [Burkholderia cenocepacia]